MLGAVIELKQACQYRDLFGQQRNANGNLFRYARGTYDKCAYFLMPFLYFHPSWITFKLLALDFIELEHAYDY